VVGEVGLPISREMLLRARCRTSVAMVDGVIRVRAIIHLVTCPEHEINTSCQHAGWCHPSMASHRSKHQKTTAYHDRVDLPDDFEVVHSWETHLNPRGRLLVDTPCSPQKGWTTWVVGDSWAPEENFEFALDLDSEWYDKQVEAPITETIEAPSYPAKPKPKKKRSKVLVSL
jgi:hypothetical protein